MSDMTVGYSPRLVDGVAAYVREVRAELDDLPVEDIDDLTGGMEADLSELAAESGGDLTGRLGSPKLYAAELRAAAGLPERLPGSGRQRRPISAALTRARASFTMLTEQYPWLRSVAAFLVTVRPAWWVLRGYLAAWALWSILGTRTTGIPDLRTQGFFEFCSALLGIVVSVQLGRGWLRRWALSRPLLVLGNAIAVIVALMALASGQGSSYTVDGYSPPPGVSVDGMQVGNIYAYDSDGRRITGVRLFAQDGRPLGGGVDAYDLRGNPIGVVRDGSGAPVTNVYPKPLFGPDPWQNIDPANPELDPGAWTPPMSIVPLISPTPTPTATSKPMPPTAQPTTPSSQQSPSVTPSGR